MNEVRLTRFITREGLTALRRDALRRRVWFSALKKRERSMVELTARCVDRVRSARLALVIGRIVCKVLKAFRSRFLERVEAVGYDLAAKICRIAVSWGYEAAATWRQDIYFVRFLGVNAINNSSGWS